MTTQAEKMLDELFEDIFSASPAVAQNSVRVLMLKDRIVQLIKQEAWQEGVDAYEETMRGTLEKLYAQLYLPPHPYNPHKVDENND